MRSPLHYYRRLAALSSFLLAAGLVCVLLGVWAGWYAVILGAAYAVLCAWSVRGYRRKAYALRSAQRGLSRLAAGVRGSASVRVYDPPSADRLQREWNELHRPDLGGAS